MGIVSTNAPFVLRQESNDANGGIQILETSGSYGIGIFRDSGANGRMTIRNNSRDNIYISSQAVNVASTSFVVNGTGAGINNQGSYAVKVATTSTNFTFGTGNFQHVIISSNGVTGTLPAISGVTDGQTYECKNMGLVAVTINPTGADTIDGETSDSITYKANMVYTACKALSVWIKR